MPVQSQMHIWLSIDRWSNRLAVIKTGMVKNGLHRLNIACCREHLGRLGVPAAMRRALLYTGLPVYPTDGLLEPITCPVNLWLPFQPMVLKSQFKGLPLVRIDQFRARSIASVLLCTRKPPSAPVFELPTTFRAQPSIEHFSSKHCAADSHWYVCA